MKKEAPPNMSASWQATFWRYVRSREFRIRDCDFGSRCYVVVVGFRCICPVMCFQSMSHKLQAAQIWA